MESRRIHLLLLLLVVVTAALSSTAVNADSSPPANRLFVLGDSTALNFDLCVRSTHRLLVDVIADRMGLPPLPSYFWAKLRNNLTAEALAGGINFAEYRAKVLSGEAFPHNELDRLFPLLPSLSRQMMLLRDVLQQLDVEAGTGAGLHVASSAVFVISFGTDDYMELYSAGGARPAMHEHGKNGLAQFLVRQMELAVKTLYNANVRKIAFIGVGPLGCAPEIISKSGATLQGRGCNEEVNEVVSDYNAMLAERAIKLQTKLPRLQIIFCDTYRGIREIISNPHIYGFKNVNETCCRPGLPPGWLCLFGMPCDDVPSHVWRDSYLTTEAVNTLLANWSWSPSESQTRICSPGTLHQLASTL